MSVFKKSGAGPAVRLPGTKPWINSQQFTSTGCRTLDKILGGGFHCGTMVMVHQDRFSSHGKTLGNYFLAEGHGCDHRLFIASMKGKAGLTQVVNSLPLNITKAHARAKKEKEALVKQKSLKTTSSRGTSGVGAGASISLGAALPRPPPSLGLVGLDAPLPRPPATMLGLDAPLPRPPATMLNGSSLSSLDNLSTNHPTGPPDGDGRNLKIAWQYKKYMKPPVGGAGSNVSAAGSGTYCHSFDLSKHEEPDVLSMNKPTLCDLSKCRSNRMQVLLSNLKTWLQHPDATRKVSRVLLPSFGSAMWWGGTNKNSMGPSEGHAGLIHFLQCVKALVRNTPAVVMITFPSHLYPKHVVAKASHIADAVFRIDSFQGDLAYMGKQYKDLDGMFTIRKLPRLHSLACHVPDVDVFGIKRDRRSMQVERLHLPPEDDRPSTSSSLRSVPCSSSGGDSASSSLDF